MSRVPYRRKALTLSLFVGAWVSLVFAPVTHAATNAAPGFSVSPAQLLMTINQAKPSQETIVTVSNDYNTPLRLDVEAKAIDESSARLVPAGSLDSTFAAALSLSAAQLTVPPHGSAQLKVAVHNTNELQPGGHYASIVLTQRADSSAIPALRPAVAVSLFVIKSDGVTTNLQLVSVEARRTIFTLPRSVTLTFANRGNTHVVPRASAGIYSDNGSALYSQAVFNLNSAPIFPGNKASFTARMKSLQGAFLPKRLRMQIMYRIDGSDIEWMQQSQFWYIPPIGVAAVVAVCSFLWWQRRAVKRLLRQCARVGKTARRFLKKLWRKVVQKPAKQRRSERHRAVGGAAIKAHQSAARTRVRQNASQVFARSLVSRAEPTTAKKPIPIMVVESPKAGKPAAQKGKPASPPKTAAVKPSATKPVKTKAAKSKKAPVHTAKKPAKTGKSAATARSKQKKTSST